MGGKIIACVNEKGGVAKTTTIKNLAVGLAMKGKKVLAIDVDPSANLTKCLGMSPENEVGSICEIIAKSIEVEDFPENFGIEHQEEGIDIVTSSGALHAYESKLSDALQREIVLRRYVYTVRDNYDYIFIDCPAGLGIFVSNALFCADSVLVPVQPQYLGVEAMQNLFVEINKVRKLNGTGRKPDLIGILFTMVRPNTNNDRRVMEELRKTNSSTYIFSTYIPLGAKIPESDLARESIYKY